MTTARKGTETGLYFGSPLVLLPVLLDRAVDPRAPRRKVLRRHRRPHRESCMKRQEPGFGDGGQLRRLFHIEEYVPRALAIVFREVRRFRLELVQDTLNRASQCAVLGSRITGFDGD